MNFSDGPITADGTYPDPASFPKGIPVNGSDAPRNWWAQGYLGGGTLVIEISYDDGANWEAVTDGNTLVAGQFTFWPSGRVNVRLIVSSSSGANFNSGIR